MKYLILILAFPLACQGQKTEEELFYHELGQEKTQALKDLVDIFDDFLDTNFPKSANHHERIEQFLNAHLQPFNSNKFIFDLGKIKPTLLRLENSRLRKDIYLLVASQNIRGNLYNSWDEEYQPYSIEALIPEDTSSYQIDMESEIEAFYEANGGRPKPGEILEIAEDTLAIKSFEQVKLIFDNLKYHYRFNPEGHYLYALAKLKSQNRHIASYTEALYAAGDLSPTLMAQGILTEVPENEWDSWFSKMIMSVHLYYLEILHFELRSKK